MVADGFAIYIVGVMIALLAVTLIGDAILRPRRQKKESND